VIPVAERPISIHRTPRTDQGADVGVAGGPACRKVPRTGASCCGQYYARQADDSMRGHGPCPSGGKRGEPTDSRHERSASHSPFASFGGRLAPAASGSSTPAVVPTLERGTEVFEIILGEVIGG